MASGGHLSTTSHLHCGKQLLYIRACLHGGGGTQVGEVTCLIGGVTRL